MPTVSVAGAQWPLNKFAAVVAALLAVGSVLLVGGTAITGAWVGAALSLAVWWGGYAAVGARWDHGPREYAARSRREEH